MKKILILKIMILFAFISYGQTSAIRLNQLGFYPKGPKVAAIIGSSATTFTIKSVDRQTTYFTGNLSTASTWVQSNESVKTADFTSFEQEGNFVVDVPNLGYSYTFSIKNNVLVGVNKALIRAFYYNRSSIALTSQYAGIYARAAGHPDNNVIVHPSAANNQRPAGTIISCPKGWYDAGDYNSYVVNSGVSTYSLLLAYDQFKSYYDTLNLNIPESGNAIPDILDEAKWNIDWMLSMQDPTDGGVYSKKTNAWFDGTVMPAAATNPRYVVTKTTHAALNFAAVMAVSSRLYQPFNSAFASQCLTAAQSAYNWALNNPSVYSGNAQASTVNGVNYPATNTGEYEPGQWTISSTFEWAATELYITTKQNSYYTSRGFRNSNNYGTPGWIDTRSLGLFSLVQNRKNLTSVAYADTTNMKNKILAMANGLTNYQKNNSPYKIAMGQGGDGDFEWGSNGIAATQSMILLNAYLCTKNKDYLNAAISNIDYLLGRNATTYCFVTGQGSKPVNKIHHRPSQADGIVNSIPGWLSGGPSGYTGDGCIVNNDIYKAISFADEVNCYTKNEVTINWNAPFAYVSGAYDLLNTYNNVSTCNQPSPPTVVSQISYNLNDVPVQLTATGTNLKWYTIETGGTASNVAPTPSTKTVGTSTYYVSQTNNQACESAKASITVTITNNLKVEKTYTPIVIDGIADATWSIADENSFAVNTIQGTISNTNDLSGTFQLLWDDTYLYIFGKVIDDVKQNESIDGYQDDGVEVYFDFGNNKSATYDANDVLYGFGWNDNTISVTPNNRTTTGINFITLNTNNGYNFESRIPWTALGGTAQVGQLHGFDFHVNDDDDGGNRDGKLSWNASIDNAWQVPSLFGTIMLSQVITGLDAKVLDNSILVYPNPTTDYLTIQNITKTPWKVFDMRGVEIMSGEGNTVNTSNLNNGLYILEINNSRIKFQKIKE